VDWELELAVVIGRTVRDVSVDDALGAVAGYSIINDISARSLDWDVTRDDDPWNAFFDWLNGKWLDGFAPMGPWLLTADEVPDPQRLHISLSVNGKVRQDASTRDMIFSVAELIAFTSRLMTLQPGDIIATGTPAGVGATTQTYLAPGDVIEGTIDGLGTLTTPVVGPSRGPGKLLSTMYNSRDAGDRGGDGDRKHV
jgi:2-keto-4-pentenoate hydratase/2-oxohepta-3-ene-1,7-dioic acid hydratase in catechol pathway